MSTYADTTIRVRYSETDQMGVAHHANHFIWFESGRIEFCRHLGFEYKQMEVEDDSLIVVVKASCRYRRPVRFDDVLTVRTRASGSQRRTIHFEYEIFSQTGELVATGETLHVVCDRLGRPKSLPEKYHKYFPPNSAPTRNRREHSMS
jgi:acyl-CoA thioester hydrolase